MWKIKNDKKGSWTSFSSGLGKNFQMYLQVDRKCFTLLIIIRKF